MGYKFFTLLSVILIIAQLALVLSSWIVVSIIPSLALKSLLSGEGIRWFLGSFADNIANPSLAWLVLCAMAYGVCVRSGLCKALFALMGGGALTHRQRHALYWSFAVFVILASAMSLLVFIPHSMLLGFIQVLCASRLFPCWHFLSCPHRLHMVFPLVCTMELGTYSRDCVMV